MTFERFGRAVMAVVVIGSMATATTGIAAEKHHADSDATPKRFKATSGKVDVRMKHRIRMLVPYSKTYFFVDHGKQYGAAAELGPALQQWINRQNSNRADHVVVDFVPVPRDKLLPALLEGQGDLIAADVPITKDQEAQVVLTNPWMADITEVVVTGPASPKINTLQDLSGKEVYVRHSSAYAANLFALNKDLAAKNVTPIALRPADENLEDEDLLEMVNAGLLSSTIVDENVAKMWGTVFDHLTIHSDIAIHTGGKISWVVRKDNPQLLAALNAFLQTRPPASADVKFVRKRYYSTAQIVSNVYGDEQIERFERLQPYFRHHADEYHLDSLLLAAQGYQESQLKQTQRGPHGTIGIMQLLPSTAATPEVGIKNVYASADRNIEAGAKYMRYLMDTYIDDPKIDPTNRMLMGLAAYNAGPENLNRFREAAARAGLNPNLWFGNVENGAARVAGRGTVQYVSNIYKYYVAYKLRNEKTDTEAVAVQPTNQQ